MTQNNEQEIIIATHEAAHAAICLKEKVPFKNLSIIPGENYSGIITHSEKSIGRFQDDSFISEDKKFLLFRKYLMCVVAGFVAENKMNSQHSSIHAENDCEHAFLQAGKFFANHKTAQAFVDYIISEVEDSFTYLIDEENKETEDSEVWKFILVLRDELIQRKELSYRKCKRLYESF